MATPQKPTIDIDFFNENGFLTIPDFFSPDQLKGLSDEMAKLIKDYEIKPGAQSSFQTAIAEQQDDAYFLASGNKISFFLEESVTIDDKTGELNVPKENAFNKVAHALHDYNKTFELFSYNPVLFSILKQLGYTTPQIVQSMYIFKSPNVGAAIFPHQDSSFIQTTPHTCIGLWVSLDDASIENGCMYFVPGSHKAPIERMFNLKEDKTGCEFNIEGYKYDTSKAIPVPVKAGTLVLIHGSVVHFSGHNNSDKRRNAYSLHIIDGAPGIEYPSTNWLQRPPEQPFRNFEDVTTELFGKHVVAQCLGDEKQ